ncbi:unnamed protein product [Heterobilharzia americana]|nr:unnamed protein product [Heterobilharzia americana]
MPGGSVYTGGDESISLPSKSLEQESDSNWSFPDTENVSIDTSGNKSSHPESFDDPITVSYSVPNIVNRLPMSTSAAASKEKQTDGDRKK